MSTLTDSQTLTHFADSITGLSTQPVDTWRLGQGHRKEVTEKVKYNMKGSHKSMHNHQHFSLVYTKPDWLTCIWDMRLILVLQKFLTQSHLIPHIALWVTAPSSAHLDWAHRWHQLKSLRAKYTKNWAVFLGFFYTNKWNSVSSYLLRGRTEVLCLPRQKSSTPEYCMFGLTHYVIWAFQWRTLRYGRGEKRWIQTHDRTDLSLERKLHLLFSTWEKQG